MSAIETIFSYHQLSTTEEFLAAQLADNKLVELRHERGRIWHTGWFTELPPLLREARARSREGNLYVSLNAPRPRPVGNSMTGQALRDDEVQWITRLPFDFDPERPAGVCSTEAELRAACDRRNALVAMLRKLGWPWPLHAKSGNGYHAVFRVLLPNSAETAEMLGALYQGLHGQFDAYTVRFDRSVRNPGRIFRLYGSINRKGPNTSERPHRQSTCAIPPEWRQVDPRLIAELANYYARQTGEKAPRSPAERSTATGRGDYATLDVVAWFAAHGLYRGPIRGHLHAVTCPWSDEHTTASPRNGGDTVIFEAAGGWPGFHCKHGHCAGRTIRDVIQLWGDADAFCAREHGRAS